MFKKIFGKKSEEKAADEAVNIITLFVKGKEIFDSLSEETTPDDKRELANNLLLFGVAGAVCDMKRLSDDLYFEVIHAFFLSRGLNPQYIKMLFDLSQDQGASNAAFMAIVEGKKVFQDWSRGDKEAPLKLNACIEKYSSDSAFPSSPGHLAIALMERKAN